MKTRHFARSLILQTLFELDSAGFTHDPVETLATYVSEFAPRSPHTPYMERVLLLIIAKRAEIDAIIVTAAPEWPLDKIAVVDRNILRLGLAELLFGDRTDVPPKVALNEAIELGKEFGGESSSRFINGVLGAVYKNIGEPNKADGGVRKTGSSKQLPEELMVGALVYAINYDKRELYIALVHDVFGFWTLPKGRITPEEDLREAAVRKVFEETSLPVVIEEELGMNEYVAHDPSLGKHTRKATFFLARAPYQDIVLTSGGGLDDAKWFKLTNIGTLRMYDDLIPIITKALQSLSNKL